MADDISPYLYGMITEDSVREAIDTARIEDVVGDFVNLRRRGNNYTGLCPFHNEKTPSFNVNPARNIYKCFGCGVGGDPVKFLMELEQLSFPDAIKWIAGKYNIKLEEKQVSQEVREELQERESLIITNDFARAYFADQLYHTEEGKSVGLGYFKQRGFRKDTIETFGLGYAPIQRDGLYKAALAAGHKEEQLEKLGLVRKRRDFFYDRVMFTIHNVAGKPIAFAGRILKQNVKAPKYINSPETEVYHKSDVLYGMYQARQTVRKLNLVYMVEGYTDVISLYQNGLKNVVATSGTSLTGGQARLVKRFTENVTLLYDGDKAGIKAALRAWDVLLTNDLQCTPWSSYPMATIRIVTYRKLVRPSSRLTYRIRPRTFSFLRPTCFWRRPVMTSASVPRPFVTLVAHWHWSATPEAGGLHTAIQCAASAG